MVSFLLSYLQNCMFFSTITYYCISLVEGYFVNLFLFSIGYNYVHTIPNGARDILIKQHGVVSGLDEDGNYLGALI